MGEFIKCIYRHNHGEEVEGLLASITIPVNKC